MAPSHPEAIFSSFSWSENPQAGHMGRMSVQPGISRLALYWSNSPPELPDNEGLYEKMKRHGIT
jgi:hypothetical protein